MKKYCNSIAQIIAAILFSSLANAESVKFEEYQITAKKLDNSRAKLSPKTGSSSFSFNRQDIENLPLGQATSMNQVLTRAPGVTQDSFGQIHVRGDHSNVQYRINGVVIPKGIGSFGQTLDTRFVESVDLLTGALPAQYGFRTGGVVDIRTKDGAFKKGGRSELMLGGYDTKGAAQEFSGAQGRLNYYVNASYLENSRGIEAPNKTRYVEHDDTKQNKAFGYFSYLIDASSKINFIVANAENKFQIPNNANQEPVFNLNSADNVLSSGLNQKQNERNSYAIASLQGVSDAEIDYQISFFTRQSQVKYRGDNVGDLVFNGIASDVDRSSLMNGLQGDFSYQINDKNILRSGFFLSDELVKNRNNNLVFAADDNGLQTSAEPFSIGEKSAKHSQNYSLYLQNEYKSTQKLSVNYGVRFDAFKSYKSENQISPRLGAAYDFSKKTKIHAGFARYFTPPQNELVTSSSLAQYQNTTNAPNSLVNDSVKSERTNYYDVGISHNLESGVNIGLNAYYKDIRNVLDEGRFGQSLIYTPFNYARGRAYGVEFVSDYKRDNFSGYFNLALQKAQAKKIISGQHLFDQEQLNYIANHYVHLDHDQSVSASAGSSYLWQETKYFVDAIYGSGLRKDFANTKHLPSYLQLSAGAARDFDLPVIEKFNLRFSIVNLLDKSYKLRDGSGIGVGAPQYGQRRTAYLTFSKSF